MKLEYIGVLLEKDPTEIAGSLNLADGVLEVEDQEAVKLIGNHLKELKISKLSEGKKQAEGLAKRTVLSEVESKIKALGIDGDNFDDLIIKLDTRLKEKQGPPDDSKFKVQLDAYKNEVISLKEALQKEQEKAGKIELRQKVMAKLNPVLSKYEFGSEKAKIAAVSEFVETNKFITSDDEIFIDIQGKPSVNFEKIAESSLSQWGKIKTESGGTPPKHFQQSNLEIPSDLPTLYDMLRKAKTAEEKATIMEAIQKHDK